MLNEGCEGDTYRGASRTIMVEKEFELGEKIVPDEAIILSTRCRLRITADKRLRCFAPSPKLPSATSFIRSTLYEMRRQIGDNNEQIL
jgi:hypothetical protein